MESEFEWILKSEKKASATSTRVLLVVGLFGGVTMGLLGCVAEFAASVSGRGNLCLVLAAFIFIGYYQIKQSKVNLELAKAIEEIRERLDQQAPPP